MGFVFWCPIELKDLDRNKRVLAEQRIAALTRLCTPGPEVRSSVHG